MTSQWYRCRLKSPPSRLFTQPFIQGADQRKNQSSASLAFVRGIQRSPVNSPLKGPVTRKKFPFGDVIMRFKSNFSHSKSHNTQFVRGPQSVPRNVSIDVLMICHTLSFGSTAWLLKYHIKMYVWNVQRNMRYCKFVPRYIFPHVLTMFIRYERSLLTTSEP